MKLTEFEIPGLKLIETDCFGDERGWFMETYSYHKYKEMGIDCEFIQDNHSMSQKKGTLRGLHWQNEPCAQAKLVRCIKGKIMDVAVDIRLGSPTYKKWLSVELSEDNKKIFYIPKGFAHGFLCLSDNVEFQYKVDSVYSKEHDRGIRYDDPEIGVDWGSLLNGIDPILSNKDINSGSLSESDCNFKYKGEK